MARTPSQKAAHTGRWAETMFRALTRRVAKRWRFVSFRGQSGAEWRGIVDVLAVRKSTAQPRHSILKAGDLFDLVIIQLKGGDAADPSPGDLRRLQAVRKALGAGTVVLYSWKRGAHSTYRVLNRRGQWVKATARSIFG